MVRYKGKKHSIVYHLTRLILGIIILQTLLFSAILIEGGVIEQAEENTYQLFSDKVSNRKDYVQREMKANWTNFDPYLSNIAKIIPRSGSDTEDYFRGVITELIAALRTTQVTGAYVILLPEGDNVPRCPALYIRDYDPVMNAYGNDDLYMVYGPSELAKQHKIPLDQTWQYNFSITQGNSEFIKKPYEAATIASQATFLGYWSKPFKLNEADVSVIAYSIPFFDSHGELRGVFGIEITLNYLAKFFPATELQAQDSLGYLIAFSTVGENMTPIVMGGALQQRMIKKDNPLVLTPVKKDKNIYQIENHNGKEDLYAAVEKIGLYPFNTPFENEQWHLIGIMREDYLLRATSRIKNIIAISLFVAIVIGAIGGTLISFRVSKPIVSLAGQVKESEKKHELTFTPTGLTELDELSQSVQTANRLMVEAASRLTKIVDQFGLPIGAFEWNRKLGRIFMTDNFLSILNVSRSPEAFYHDQNAFFSMLHAVLNNPESDETDVFAMEGDVKRWIRYKQSENEETVIGIVMDVTDEIQEKKQIKRERDYDPLTSLLNRKGFQWEYEVWRRNADSRVSALIMFDLDNLKHINDCYGHKWGDQLILTAVEQLKTIAPPNHMLLGRRSGDEFVLLLYDYDEKKEIIQTMEAFYKALPMMPVVYPDGTALPVAISGGIMWITPLKLTYDELLHFADEALYVAKRTRKGYFVVSQAFADDRS